LHLLVYLLEYTKMHGPGNIKYFIFIFVLFAGFVRIRIDSVLLNNQQRVVLCNETE
jgi:hypothetical protein